MRTPSLTLARIRLRWHRRAVAFWLAVSLTSAGAGYLAAGTNGAQSRRADPSEARITSGPPPSSSTSTAATTLAGRLRPGMRAITVPMPETVPELHVGDRIDLIAGPLAAGVDGAPPDRPGTSVVVEALEVIDVRPGAVTVAAPKAQAPAIAAAITGTSVTVALVGPAG